MERSSFDIAIIGGGIVGLATALACLHELGPLRVIILEKEADIARHQTGHNSGVVHSGLYYRPGSSKARLCLEGRRQLTHFCETHGINLERCGKVIVATEPSELLRLDSLLERGRANGVEGLERIPPERLRELEPQAAGLGALYSPATGIVDFTAVAHAIAEELRRLDCTIALGARVTGIGQSSGRFQIQTGRREIEARHLINCAGLYADRIAVLAGVHPTVRIVPFRGEYYQLRPDRRHLVRALIYPVPDPRFPFLGVHFTRTVHGEIEAGPNAVLAFAREGYSFGRVSLPDMVETLGFRGFWQMARRYWATGLREFARSLSKRAFVASLRRLVPELRANDLVTGGAGVRAQAVTAEGMLVDDFHLVEAPRAIHVLNAPSPAATASFAIGQHIARVAAASFELPARP